MRTVVKWAWHPRHWHIVFGTYDAYKQTVREWWFGPLHVVTFIPDKKGE